MNRIVIAGAGPIGLHAALQATRYGFHATVLERGDVGAAVRRWSHVRLFTPFSMNSTASGRRAAGSSVRLPPDNALLTGKDYLEQYLVPLANSSPLRGCVHTSCELLAVGRQSYGKSHLPGHSERGCSPFRLLVRGPDESEFVMESDILLDCTGFITRHRFVGAGGIPCPGELSCLSDADYEIATSPESPHRSSHTVVVGSGYSAATSIRFLSESTPRITWITRGDRDVPVPPLSDDELPERRRLTEQCNRLATDPTSAVHWLPGARIESITRDEGNYHLHLSFGDGDAKTLVCDRVVANPGFRPAVRPFEELQIHRCYATEGPIRLAAHLLSDGGTNCLTRTAGDAELLRCPEPNFFVLGAASYGRDSRFLLRNGLKQIDQLFETILCPMEVPG